MKVKPKPAAKVKPVRGLSRVWGAGELLALLAARHADDLFVSECKDGPTQGAHPLRMDAWAMKRSWANPLTWGYEIKVGRGDFLSDDKWHQAKAYCNEFYFVTPPGLISPDELPKDVGLLWATVSGGRLLRQRKAHYREVEIDECFYRYILMCRTRIVNRWEVGDGQGGATDFWREWLSRKEEARDIGRRVGRALAEKYKRDVENVRHQQGKLDEELAGLRVFRDYADQHNIYLSKYTDEASVAEKLKQLRAIFPDHVLRDLKREIEGLGRLYRDLREARGDPPEKEEG